MGFNQCFLRSVEDLQSEFESNGLESFIKRYQKYDSITGSSESFEFLEQKIKEYENNIRISTDNSITDGM